MSVPVFHAYERSTDAKISLNRQVRDGSMISANPGVNPSLSITALSERAMSLIAPRDANAARDEATS